jgi:Na+-driven multidrug efflux pump
MITKRQLGLGLIAGAMLFAAGTFASDWLGAGQYDGVGPLQRYALAAAALVTIVGATLLPLGDRPA